MLREPERARRLPESEEILSALVETIPERVLRFPERVLTVLLRFERLVVVVAREPERPRRLAFVRVSPHERARRLAFVRVSTPERVFILPEREAMSEVF